MAFGLLRATSPLHAAAESQNLSLVRALLAGRADPNLGMRAGLGPLRMLTQTRASI